MRTYSRSAHLRSYTQPAGPSSCLCFTGIEGIYTLLALISTMALRILSLLILGCASAVPVGTATKTAVAAGATHDTDLKTDASTYYDRYGDSAARGYPSSAYGGVAGYGTIDDKYSYGGYGYDGYSGAGGYGPGYSGYDGYRGGYNQGYGNAGYGNAGYGNGGYGVSNYGGNSGYGGYGGYTGNGGLSSYYGYNNPNYQGNGYLGYGYYNKRPGYGNIYNSGITPSLVTGYRGYSRK